ncbi:hypothetical protein P152DRAFT_324277 [Eremomyces bilateralis CBS 781.70]|uniref:Uncharacterized protein n=1 Tax=Eremomyces bilateralis CBS 781.70 TaxID=1392243 RepID=A0A6G1FQ55_9PEZI|nr:uncharacterized protein P152DRAFT_324277 [Eremomyces bilateralis CBS 781.70]KAF1807821.1 hypothetical protein P152DRAFT_324277 [Eremomyces bilateralis CBS 781.70]
MREEIEKLADLKMEQLKAYDAECKVRFSFMRLGFRRRYLFIWLLNERCSGDIFLCSLILASEAINWISKRVGKTAENGIRNLRFWRPFLSHLCGDDD